jgi:hypothetical protein
MGPFKHHFDMNTMRQEEHGSTAELMGVPVMPCAAARDGVLYAARTACPRSASLHLATLLR